MIINKKGIGFIIACVFWLGILPIGLLQLIPYGEEFKVEELYADGLSGDGTAVYPYIVEDADDLKKVKDNLGAYYKQMADIDLSGIPNWPPIDNFEGTYDGNGYEIRNLRIVSTGQGDDHTIVGLFGKNKNEGTIKNVFLLDVNILGFLEVGALAGNNSGKISSSFATGRVEGTFRVGGLVGNNADEVKKSYFIGDVIGASGVGGLVGFNEAGSQIKECFSSGNVRASGERVGGLVGINEGTIEDAYSTSYIQGDNHIGALIGDNRESASVSQVYAKDDSRPLIGTGSSVSNGIEPLDVNKDQSTYSEYDFLNVWSIDNGNYYPYLRNTLLGFGDEDNERPFRVAVPQHLNRVSYGLEYNYKQIVDIDLYGYGYDENFNGEGWNPITEFKGRYNGARNRIINMYINR